MKNSPQRKASKSENLISQSEGDAISRWDDAPCDDEEPFAENFIVHPKEVYSRVLTTLSENTGFQKNLSIISSDIAEQIRKCAASLEKEKLFGVFITNLYSDSFEKMPFLLKYDLALGTHCSLAADSMASFRGRCLWVYYAPLEEYKKEEFEAICNASVGKSAAEISQKRVQLNLAYILAASQMTTAVSMAMQTLLLSILKHGRSLHGFMFLNQIASTQTKKDLREDINRVRIAFSKNLTNNTIPEPVRSALRPLLVKIERILSHINFNPTPK